MVCALGWEDYPCVVGGLFVLVGADGDYLRDGTEPFITIFSRTATTACATLMIMGRWGSNWYESRSKQIKSPLDEKLPISEN